MAMLVPAGITLREQLNRRFPKRDKKSDGWIGDPSHQARGKASDHNPDSHGWVHALDIDEDFGAPGDKEAFLEQLIDYARSGKPGADRIKYVMNDDRIASGTHRVTWWKWRPSNERNHRGHIHISFTAAAQDDGSPFPLPILQVPDKDEPAKPAKKAPAKKAPAKKAGVKKVAKKAVSK